MSLANTLLGAVQMLAGAVLLFTGAASALGVKLLLSGALTLISTALSARAGRKGGFDSSPTYGITDPSNAGGEGSVVPVVYGEHQVWPTIISVNVKREGGKQYFYVLCGVSQGPVSLMHSVRLDDTPIESFPGAVATVDRLGTATQTTIPDFNQIGHGYDAGTQLTPRRGTTAALAAPTHTYEMKAVGDELVLLLGYPGGIIKTNDDGEPDEAQTTQFVEVKKYGEPDTAYAAFSPASEDADEWTMEKSKAGTWSTWKKTTAAYNTHIRLRFDGKDLGGGKKRPARGRYVVRIRCDNTDKPTHRRTGILEGVIEITNDARTYPYLALLAVKLPSHEQLAGGIPVISLICKGRTVTDPRNGGVTETWSNNPVLCARDLILNTRYGLGTDLSSADLDEGVGGSWRTMADACEASVAPIGGSGTEVRHQLDYVLDVKSYAADHLQQMLQGARMTIVGTDKLIVTQDTSGAVVRSFESRLAAPAANRVNIVDVGEGGSARSSLTVRRLDASQRWNVVRAQYVDRVRNWKKRTVTVRDVYVNIGAITNGPLAVGGKIVGATSKATGRLTATYANGAPYVTYVQDDGSPAFVSGETVTLGSASFATTSAPYSASPERVLSVQLFGVTRRSQAIREARYHLNRARSTPIFATWSIGPGDLDVLPGDVVDVSADFTSWSGKQFTVLSSAFNADGVGIVEGREYSSDVYADNLDSHLADVASYQPGGAVPPGLRTPSDTQATSGAGAGAGAPPGGSSSSSSKGNSKSGSNQQASSQGSGGQISFFIASSKK